MKASSRPYGDWSGVAYHGTPSRTNAKAIFQNGFLVGNGNASGDGVYFATDPAIAKSYAGSQGVILKCQLRGRCCQWNDQIQAQYAQWCGKNGVRQDNSARTAYLIQRGYDLLRTGSVVVVLSPRWPTPAPGR